MSEAHKYYDIEGQLVTATVNALRAINIPTTEMFAGDSKPGQRVEVKADVIGETGQEAIGATGAPVRIGYRLNLMLVAVTPIDQPEEHKSLRGRARQGLSMPYAKRFLGDHLPHAEILNTIAAGSSNEISAGDEDYDELLTIANYTVSLALIPGHSPTS